MKKEHWKVVISFMLFVAFISGVTSVQVSADSTDVMEPSEALEIRLQNEAVALAKYQTIYESFIDAETKKAVYPDFFGGVYLDENGDLVLCIKDNREEEAVNTLQKLNVQIEDTEIKKVTYAFNELKAMQNAVDAAYYQIKDLIKANPLETSAEFLELKTLIDALTGSYVDDEENVVVVEMKNLDEQKVETFKKHFLTRNILCSK